MDYIKRRAEIQRVFKMKQATTSSLNVLSYNKWQGCSTPSDIYRRSLSKGKYSCKIYGDWDTELPQELQIEWLNILHNLKLATEIEILRQYFNVNIQRDDYQLHCFTDASQRGYGTAVYLQQGKNVSLIIAKTRVAPLKSITFPCMELMCIVLGTRLTKYVLKELKLNVSKSTVWSDSSIALSWIKSNKQLPTFVNNRVIEIKSSPINDNMYCSTTDNPADLLTPGIKDREFKTNKLRWNGPTCLQTTDHQNINSEPTVTSAMFQNYENITVNKPQTEPQPETQNRYSSLTKLLRVTAYVLKAIKCMKQKQNTDKHLTANDTICAEMMWIKSVQQTYTNEIQQLHGIKVKTS